MPINTTKIFNDGGEYITLFDLSKSQKYSLEYLLNQASCGQLKSFKMGDEWLTTMDWFNDYKKAIKYAIQIEIADKDIDHKKDWVDFVRVDNFRLRFIPQMFLLLIIFSFFSFSLSWLANSSGGQKFALATNNLVEKKYIADNYFLYYTYQVYNYNSHYLSYMVDNSLDSIGLLANSLISLGQNTAYVALVIDQNISPYKISDEIITDKINKLAKALKNQYQAVAGVSSVKTQIYFDDWQKSLKSGN